MLMKHGSWQNAGTSGRDLIRGLKAVLGPRTCMLHTASDGGNRPGRAPIGAARARASESCAMSARDRKDDPGDGDDQLANGAVFCNARRRTGHSAAGYR